MAVHFNVPIVQLSIDLPTVDEALDVATMGIRAGVDWLEVGTPLVLFEGINTVGRFAPQFPGRTIFVDAKLMDMAAQYVTLVGRLGAQQICVCAAASDATFRQAVKAGREAKVKIVADLYAVANPVGRAHEVVGLGADIVYLHYGGDEHAEDPDGDPTVELIRRVRSVVDVPIGVVTFDADNAVRAVEAGADIVLIGHPYLVGSDAEVQLADYVRRVKGAIRS